jgi:DNA-binding transcriptional LysR family regulator
MGRSSSFVKWILSICIISFMNIAGANLNLLVTLDALLAERHVSRAARRLGLSQPAVSNALGQLRSWLGDPLLVRTGSTMVPTERALALAGPVRAALQTLQAALDAPAFQPGHAERSFAIATTDFVEFVMLPRLLARVTAIAPGIHFQVVSWSHHRVPPSLETGEVDLWIGFSLELPAGHRQQDLFPDEFICILRKDHPRVGKRLTLRTYAALPHVLVTSESAGPGVVDLALAKVNLRRTVGLRMSHFLMVPPVVAATDYVAAVSRRVAQAFAPLLPLRVLPAPLPLPRGTVRQVWHERTEASPAHRWLRAQVTAVAREV